MKKEGKGKGKEAGIARALDDALVRLVERHAKRLRGGWEMKNRKGGEGRRDPMRQMEKREGEREMRKRAVAVSRWTEKHGVSRYSAAALMGLNPVTLKGWQEEWRGNRMREVKPLGRPMETSDRDLRNAVIAVFALVGPGVGLPTLQYLFPEAARAELENLQGRYRRAFKRRGYALIFALKWMVAGRVWSMDFIEKNPAIDGIYRYVLLVRDLATGVQLLALPTKTKEEKEVVAALKALFKEFGVPLVIKSDNGGEFVNGGVSDLLERHGIFPLLSPPMLPQYNGAVEAGGGAVKTRAHYEAARNDRPGEWTCDDVEAARLQANETARPRGIHGPTPDEVWQGYRPASDGERAAFRDAVRAQDAELRRQHGFFPNIELAPADQDRINRESITKALAGLGYLEFRRRRLSLPLFGQKQINIS